MQQMHLGMPITRNCLVVFSCAISSKTTKSTGCGLYLVK